MDKKIYELVELCEREAPESVVSLLDLALWIVEHHGAVTKKHGLKRLRIVDADQLYPYLLG